MPKSVLLSVQPKWCELIASGKKTVEVRKTRPKIDTPFKCYIYQTRKTWVYNIYSRIADWQGKVIGEFVCDAIISHCEMSNADIAEQKGCIKREKIFEYSNGKELYGWHISDLVIYDKPKELSEFRSYNVGVYWEDGFPMPTHEIKRPPQSWCYVEG